jgi:hypothetical protein
MALRLENGPCVWFTFDDLFTTRQGANKALRKLVEERIAEVVGTVNFHGEGGNCFVYTANGVRNYKRNQIKHDVIEMLVITRLGLEYLRGDDVDEDRLQDFILFSQPKKIEESDKEESKQEDESEESEQEEKTVAPLRLHGEIDSGASTYERIETERFPKYDGCEEPTLWVSCGLWNTNDKTRLKGLKDRSGGRTRFWFVTLQQLLDEGLDAVLVNCEDEEKTVSDLLTDPEPPSP